MNLSKNLGFGNKGDVLNILRIFENEKILYKAGIPSYPRNFTRDSIISAILMQNPKMLRDQLIFCAEKQGTKKNPYTGEEFGKIFHEYPGVEIRGLSTMYNACDTTALFLIGHKVYYNLTKDSSLIEEQKENIKRAVEYIKRHLKKGLFTEDPMFCGAKRFALKTTYWKDSQIIGRRNGEPVYPVVYFLAHIQNMHAIRCAVFLLRDNKLEGIADKMKSALKKLFNSKTEIPYIAVDKKGSLKGISSDFVHSLMYLEKEDINKNQLNSIIKSLNFLETEKGYLVIDKKTGKKAKDKYHAETIWPFEQAIIHIGAEKFGIKKAKEVSARVFRYLKTAPEVISEKNNVKSCDPQLWTIAAKTYFSNYLRKKKK